MNTSSSADKRQYLRLPRPYRVQVREITFPIAKDPLLESHITDISKGGLCIESEAPFTIGTQLCVSVHIPLLNKFSNGFFKVYENDAEQYFQAIAEIAWSKPLNNKYLVGLKFTNIDEDLTNALEKLINKAFLEETDKINGIR